MAHVREPAWKHKSYSAAHNHLQIVTQATDAGFFSIQYKFSARETILCLCACFLPKELESIVSSYCCCYRIIGPQRLASNIEIAQRCMLREHAFSSSIEQSPNTTRNACSKYSILDHTFLQVSILRDCLPEYY